MLKKVTSWVMIAFMAVVIAVGFAEVVTPTQLKADWRCEHGDQHPPCPSHYYFKYCDWEYYWDPVREEMV